MQASLISGTAMAVPVQQQQQQMMVVTCPAGAMAGAMIQIQAPSGQPMQVAVPQGIGPGMQFQVQAPAAAAAAFAQPVHMAMQQAAQPVMQQQQVLGAFQAQVPQQVQQAPGPGDYRILAQFGDLFIKQQIEMLEIFTGFEGANKYDIFGMMPGMGQQHLFHAAEVSAPPCCCSPCYV
jgi:hypothetical protein